MRVCLLNQLLVRLCVCACVRACVCARRCFVSSTSGLRCNIQYMFALNEQACVCVFLTLYVCIKCACVTELLGCCVFICFCVLYTNMFFFLTYALAQALEHRAADATGGVSRPQLPRVGRGVQPVGLLLCERLAWPHRAGWFFLSLFYFLLYIYSPFICTRFLLLLFLFSLLLYLHTFSLYVYWNIFLCYCIWLNDHTYSSGAPTACSRFGSSPVIFPMWMWWSFIPTATTWPLAAAIRALGMRVLLGVCLFPLRIFVGHLSDVGVVKDHPWPLAAIRALGMRSMCARVVV